MGDNLNAPPQSCIALQRISVGSDCILTGRCTTMINVWATRLPSDARRARLISASYQGATNADTRF